MAEDKLTAKEKLFCRYMAFLGEPGEAALRAGYPAKKALTRALRLLDKPAIKEEVKKLEGALARDGETGQALRGLRRIAFGMGNDALRLLGNEEALTQDDIALLDLFGISEIKKPKGGGLEVKFYDRLKALEMLLTWGDKGMTAREGGIYEALERSAARLDTLYADAEAGGDGDAACGGNEKDPPEKP
ncbi:MAG: terminase small subunit [Oscillospiraceae bacterium]|jgi:hypothetical protein|nr:terminase small subunit [Oscillospiraceae bacterium]